MLQQKYDTILEKIIKETGLTKPEIESRIRAKLRELQDLISQEGAAHIVANELKVKLFEQGKPQEYTIKEIQQRTYGVKLTAKILNKFDVRVFTKNGQEHRVFSLIIGDSTGRVRLTIWDELVIDQCILFPEGTVITIENGYTRENNGFFELHVGSKAKITKEDKELDLAPKKRLKDVAENEFLDTYATVVDMFEPRYYDACPECNRKVNMENGDYFCQNHKKVLPQKTPIINLVIDDGTDVMRVVCFRDVAEKIINDKPFQELKQNLNGSDMKFKGRVVFNSMSGRKELRANIVEEANPEELLQQV